MYSDCNPNVLFLSAIYAIQLEKYSYFGTEAGLWKSKSQKLDNPSRDLP